MKRTLSSAAIVGLGMVAMAAPAMATASFPGSNTCNSQQTVAFNLNTQGQAAIYRQGYGTPLAQRNSTGFITWSHVTSYRSLNWVITAGDYVPSSTYGYCLYQ